VGLSRPENVADLLADYQRRCIQADTTRLEAVLLGLDQVNL